MVGGRMQMLKLLGSLERRPMGMVKSVFIKRMAMPTLNALVRGSSSAKEKAALEQHEAVERRRHEGRLNGLERRLGTGPETRGQRLARLEAKLAAR